jgi:putative chitinase
MSILTQLQSLHKLQPDGYIGFNTLNMLGSVLGLDTNKQKSMIIGQLSHESLGFTVGRENLNYSEECLMENFAKYFLPGEIKRYAMYAQGIANRIYANRMGNGSEASGDGFKYRGGGSIQLTGRDNYIKYFKSVGLPANSDPAVIEKLPHYIGCAKWFIENNNLKQLCDEFSIESVRRLGNAINRGDANKVGKPMGHQERVMLTMRYARLLKVI